MKILAFIGARGGSKGLPNKNILLLGGKPVIAWTIEAALGSKHINRTVISSDSDKILGIAKKFGAESIKRPTELATDTIRPEPAMVHALEVLKERDGYEPDAIALLQPTSPIRNSQDIDKAIEIMKKSKADAIVSVTEVDNRLLKSFVQNERGHLTHFTHEDFILRKRQDLPKVYCTNGAIYLVRSDFFLKTGSLYPKHTLPYVMHESRSGDLDDHADLLALRKFFRRNKKR